MTFIAFPQARREGLVVQELPPDEVVVYDEERSKAHCLNRTAALVWRACDGQTSVEGMAVRLRDELGAASLDEAQDAVWLALDRLSRAHLLQTAVTPPLVAAGMSRREFVQRLGVASLVLLPGVSSVRVPYPGQTGSAPPPSGGGGTSPTATPSVGQPPPPTTCIQGGGPCSPTSGNPCCPGLTCKFVRSFGYSCV